MVNLTSETIEKLIALVKGAGDAISEIYREENLDVASKSDQSPVTQADLQAHEVIVMGLSQLTPDIPVISEESPLPNWTEREKFVCYWLVDPLDGTKEFINRNGEFTVNIALISQHNPIFGVVYAPALSLLYYGGPSYGAYKRRKNDPPLKIQASSLPAGNQPWKIVGSRSHQSNDFKNFVKNFPEADIISMGSSLKICLVAEGAAHLYPRLGATSEWDTAAAHAVALGAGCDVINLETQTPLKYNTKRSLLNPYFVVCPNGSDLDFNSLYQKKNVVWQQTSVNKSSRSQRLKQRPCIIWFTGLSGSGKSTVANALEEKLFSLGYSTYLLDGDNLRQGLCSDLGFNDQGRVENIRRVGEVAKLFVDAGLIVITAFISPFLRERKMVRDLVQAGEFVEVYMDTPLQICEQRDIKGLYKQARRGKIKNFTGINSPYEPPVSAELVITYNQHQNAEASAKLCIEKLMQTNLTDSPPDNRS